MDLASMDLNSLDVGEAIVDHAEQQRLDWLAKRAGKFTCSRFGDLTGSGRRKDDLWSQTAMTYIYQIAGERLGSWSFEFDSAPTRWGKEHEAEAIAYYCDLTKYLPRELTTGVDAWCELAEYAGGTPDALIETDGCLEVKCPYTPQEHMRYLHEGGVPDKYEWQVIGHLLVSGREWCDFISYDPRITSERHRLYLHRVNRSDVAAKIDWLAERLHAANELVNQIIGDKP